MLAIFNGFLETCCAFTLYVLHYLIRFKKIFDAGTTPKQKQKLTITKKQQPFQPFLSQLRHIDNWDNNTQCIQNNCKLQVYLLVWHRTWIRIHRCSTNKSLPTSMWFVKNNPPQRRRWSGNSIKTRFCVSSWVVEFRKFVCFCICNLHILLFVEKSKKKHIHHSQGCLILFNILDT